MLNIGNLSGSIFINFFLLSVIETPGYYFGIWVLVQNTFFLAKNCLFFSIFILRKSLVEDGVIADFY